LSIQFDAESVSTMNGKPGDHPITDIVKWKVPRFSPTADALIAEIVQLGAERELESAFNLFAPPGWFDFEAKLKEMRDRIHADRKQKTERMGNLVKVTGLLIAEC